MDNTLTALEGKVNVLNSEPVNAENAIKTLESYEVCLVYILMLQRNIANVVDSRLSYGRKTHSHLSFIMHRVTVIVIKRFQ